MSKNQFCNNNKCGGITGGCKECTKCKHIEDQQNIYDAERPYRKCPSQTSGHRDAKQRK